MRTNALAGICAVILTIGGAACTRSSTYSSKDGSVTVEQKGKDVNSMTFTGKDGQKVTMDVGGGKVPADYPKDLPVYDAKVVMSQTVSEKNARNLMLETSDPAAKVVEFYKKGLESSGWKVENAMSSDKLSIFTATKDKRQTVVQVMDLDEKRTINQVLSDKQ